MILDEQTCPRYFIDKRYESAQRGILRVNNYLLDCFEGNIGICLRSYHNNLIALQFGFWHRLFQSQMHT